MVSPDNSTGERNMKPIYPLKYTGIALALALAALALPGRSAEVTVLQPADSSVLRGTVEFKIRAQHAQGEQLIANPMVTLQDEVGTQLQTTRTLRDPKTGLCSMTLETSRFKDGLYYATIAYRSIMNGKVQDTEQDMTFGIRNGSTRATKVGVQYEDREYPVKESCAVTVKVLDQRGRPMPAARIAFKAENGQLDQDTRITDSGGETTASVDVEEAGVVTLTITVENLPPVRRAIRFVP